MYILILEFRTKFNRSGINYKLCMDVKLFSRTCRGAVYHYIKKKTWMLNLWHRYMPWHVFLKVTANIFMFFIVDRKMLFSFAVFHSFAIVRYMLNSLNLKYQLHCRIIASLSFLFYIVQFFYHCLCTSTFFFILNLFRVLAYAVFYGVQPFTVVFHEFTLFLCGLLIIHVKPLPNCTSVHKKQDKLELSA